MSNHYRNKQYQWSH